jgi:hypothetical protein
LPSKCCNFGQQRDCFEMLSLKNLIHKQGPPNCGRVSSCNSGARDGLAAALRGRLRPWQPELRGLQVLAYMRSATVYMPGGNAEATGAAQRGCRSWSVRRMQCGLQPAQLVLSTTRVDGMQQRRNSSTKAQYTAVGRDRGGNRGLKLAAEGEEGRAGFQITLAMRSRRQLCGPPSRARVFVFIL